MKNFTTGICLAILSVLPVSQAFAQESKIGYINTQRITTESALAKAAQVKLDQEFAKRQKDLTEQQASLKAFAEKFEREAPTLTETQRVTKQKEYAELSRDYQRKQREFQEDGNGRRNEELQVIYEKANKAVKVVGEAEKFDLILQVDGPGVIAYSNNRLDVTDKVLKILNSSK